MRYRPLGKSGMEASVIGLGTWAMGGFQWGGSDEEKAVRAIHAALDAGITLIDTAPFYGQGLAEEIVGKALQGRREKVVLATKCGLRWDLEKGEFFFKNKAEKLQVYRYLGADGIREEVERSLRRLRTDCIDLYQTHWQDSTTPIEETMEALLKLKKEGKIRGIGVSNVTPSQLRQYLQAGEVTSDQELFNMLDRHHAEELFPLCRKEPLAVIAYSPMAMGLLSGKVDAQRRFARGDMRRFGPCFSFENRAKVNRFLEGLTPMAQRHGLTLAQLVVAWTAAQADVTHVLCGARNPEQAKENARAGEVHLEPNEVAAIDRAIEEADFQLPHLFGR